MNELKRIVYLSNAQAQTLFDTGSVTSNGITVNYDENDLYVTPDTQLQADWEQTVTTADDYIKNKPSLGSAAAATVATTVGNNANLPTGAAIQAYIASLGYSTTTGTVTSVKPGNGLINGTSGTSQTAITGSGTISIGEGKVTNVMLAGSITPAKLDSSATITIGTQSVKVGGSFTSSTLLTDLGISGAMHFKGTKTSLPSNTTGYSDGDVILVGNKEYVASGTSWIELGDESSYAVKATTLAGYGITDAKIANGVITLGSNTITPLTSQFNTHLYVNATAAGATSNAATANTTTYIHLYDTTTKRETIQLKGAGGASVTATNGGVITITSANDDTKNTAGATNTSSKIFLIGATAQDANPQTYSHDTAYVGTDGCLYSGGTKVLTAHQTYTQFTGKPTGNQTPAFGGTFTIQQISQSTTGQVSGTDRTVTIPATIATNTAVGLVKPWYTHTAASSGPTTGTNATAITVNTITTTSGKYYAVEADSNGRLFVNVPWSDSNTQNTAGSTNSTSKLFLIGATTQAANPTTNSYQYTYTNNGLLSALKVGLNLNGTEKAHMEWNDTDQSIDFVFA